MDAIDLFSAAATTKPRDPAAYVMPVDPANIPPLCETGITDAMDMGNTLILMACSATKRPIEPGTTARLIDLYDGPAWRTLRTHTAGHRPRVVVLSGVLGILSAHAHAGTYEGRISTERADELIRAGLLAPQTRWGAIKPGTLLQSPPLASMRAPASGRWRGVIVCAGEEYRRVWAAMLHQLRQHGDLAADAGVAVTAGGIGEQRGQLGQWLKRLAGQTLAQEVAL